jgi:hypothetical protein
MLTESENKEVHQYSWSSLVRNGSVLFGSLEKANPSELSISLKQEYPNMKVLIVRQGENLTSLPQIVDKLDSIATFSKDEAIFLKAKNAASDGFGAAIVLPDEISELNFPRAPIHDWDFIEFSMAFDLFQVIETDLFIGKQTSTFDSIKKEITKLKDGQI